MEAVPWPRESPGKACLTSLLRALVGDPRVSGSAPSPGLVPKGHLLLPCGARSFLSIWSSSAP